MRIKASICLKCLWNDGLRNQFSRYPTALSTCSNCKQENAVCIDDQDAAREVLQEFFNATSHQVGFYFECNNKRIVQESFGEKYKNDLKVPYDLDHDLQLIHKIFDLVVSTGSPRLFNYGIFNRMNLHEDTFSRNDCEEIVQKSIPLILKSDTSLYRVRRSPQSHDPTEFDSPPCQYPKGRFDLQNLSTLYCAQDADTCVYEARILPGDDALLARFEITTPLRILDLPSVKDPEFTDPHESMELILEALTNSRYSHRNLQTVSTFAHSLNYDGIRYRSFYSQMLKHDTFSVVLFGSPIRDSKIKLSSLNRINLRSVQMKYDLGPCEGLLL